MKLWLQIGLLLCFSTAALQCCGAEFSAIFGNSMVLQRDVPLKIFGTAAPGAEVKVTLGSASAVCNADADGYWSAMLPPQPVNAHGITMTAADNVKTTTLTNILVGDVFLCSGQSNMEWHLINSQGGKEAIANSTNPLIRLYFPHRRISEKPLRDAAGKWYFCKPLYTPKFSGVGYFFAAAMQKATSVPIGIINCSRGASIVEAWMPEEALKSIPEGREMLEWYQNQLQDYDQKYTKFKADMEEFNRTYKNPQDFLEEQKRCRQAGKKVPIKPFVPVGPEHPHCVTGLYNAQIAPMTGFRLKGVIFYQGESNSPRADKYAALLTTMVKAWRKTFDDPDLIFVQTQLPNYGKTFPNCRENEWANLRFAQYQATKLLPDLGMVVTIDLGDPVNIHPGNKKDVGERLANYILKHHYKMDIPADYPIFRTVTFNGAAAVVEFEFAEGLHTTDGQAPRAFQLAGPDGKFQWATAQLKDGKITVTAPGVTEASALRYAWEYSPPVNLINGDGLPAMPFEFRKNQQ